MIPPASAFWKELHGKRHEWAFRAYDHFMASLSDQVRERMGHKSADEEAYLVVFGQTQVGKTTLLMDLMGITPDAMARVSAVLRGGREPGRSATATAMEYRRSPDHRWGLRHEGQALWMDTDDCMTQALGALREAMEEQRLPANCPCVVLVPADCFGTDPEQPMVRMLDLPGDQPSNPVELEHVRTMALQYIPLADLVLLVGRGDDLTFLQPGRLTLPGIENWQRMPERFRIITTFSFFPQTIRDTIRAHPGSLDVGELRKHLIREIETAGALMPRARQPHRFFPLEFGTSWLDARASQPNLYERVSPLIAELKHQLRQDIRASTGSFARLKGAVLAHTVVTDLMDERLAVLQSELNEVLARIGVQEKELTQVLSAAADALRKLKKFRRLRRQLDPRLLGQDVLEHRGALEEKESLSAGKSVSGFRSIIEQTIAALIQHVFLNRPLKGPAPGSQDHADRQAFWRQMSIGDRTAEVSDIVQRSFRSLITELDAYFQDSYWRSSSYQKDMRLFNRCRENAWHEVRKAASAWWLDAGRQGLAQVEADVAIARDSFAEWRESIAKLQEDKEMLEGDVKACNERRRELQVRVEKELSESRRFVHVLDKHYLAELRQRRRDVAGTTRPSQRLAALLAAVQLSDARKELLRNVEYEPT